MKKETMDLQQQPVVIGVNFAAIESVQKLVKEFCAKLNAVGNQWKQVFEERIQLRDIRALGELRSPVQFAQSQFMQSNPHFRKLVDELKLKEDKALEMLNIPIDFTDLKATVIDIIQIEGLLQAKTGLWGDQLVTFSEQSGYAPSSSLLDDISPRFTDYARSDSEIQLYKKVKDLCDLINWFNDNGANINMKEFPSLERFVQPVKTGIPNRSLKKCVGALYDIMHWAPENSLLRSPLADIIMTNLKD